MSLIKAETDNNIVSDIFWKGKGGRVWENTYDNEIAILYQISQIHENGRIHCTFYYEIFVYQKGEILSYTVPYCSTAVPQ